MGGGRVQVVQVFAELPQQPGPQLHVALGAGARLYCYFHNLGSKVLNYRVSKVSILGIVILVLGRYLIVVYLDPWGHNLGSF